MLKFKYIFLFLQLFLLGDCFAQGLQVKDGWIYVDGKKFFIKGIGYETHTRPGQVPWIYSFDPELIRFDLDKIKNAGFNTIRTWGELTEEELKLVDESGLKILYGIWIDPQGEFGNATFRASVINQVNSVLNYSYKYNCIIGYLIMNEPQTEHIYNSGSQNLLTLWQSVISLIHQKHLGVPVSFSNATVGDYINFNSFDFTAFNAYIYDPVTISASHGYSGFLKYLRNNSPQNPYVVTEFGLSVSPGVPASKYTYGGNSRESQSAGDLFMYRELIDAGAQGGCVFQYHDGWWKSGNELVHDPLPEEWFGLIEFANASDKYGATRPAWTSFETYNKAIITNPVNQEIYIGNIPLEIFSTNDVSSFSISAGGNLLQQQNISNNYYNGFLNINQAEDYKDLLLTFTFFNSAGTVLKTESISILNVKTFPQLPDVHITIWPSNLNPGGKNYLQYEVINRSPFEIDGNILDYVSHPHIGFDEGTAKTKIISLSGNRYSFQDYFDIPASTKVATFGAGFTVKYGSFKKRIYNQKILTYGQWADPIKTADVVTNLEENVQIDNAPPQLSDTKQNYPNPFNASTSIEYNVTRPGLVRIDIYNSIGQFIIALENYYKTAGRYNTIWDGRNFAGQTVNSGVYIYRMSSAGSTLVKKMLLLK